MAVEEFDPEGFFSLQPEELGSERNAITSGVAGIISGIIKIPGKPKLSIQPMVPS